MNGIVKLSFLVLLASVVANAAPIQDDVVIATAVDDIDEAHGRGARSSDSVSIPWHLDRIDQRKPQLNGKYNPFDNATGAGVDIYILAEGIDYENEEFGGRASHERFMPERGCNVYGTAFASLAAGKDYGVAKHANIQSVNLMSCQLSTSFTNVARAVNYVIRVPNETGRRSVLAMPLTGRKSSIVNVAVKEAVKANIVVVTAAGNSLQDACEYSPGSSPHTINVGATRMEDGEDKLHDIFFSGTNYGPCVALYAPGESVRSINRWGSGTAEACSIVAGAAALVLEKHPDYTPAEVKQHLINIATNGVINMEALRFLRGDKGTNKLLYVGNGLDDDVSDGSDVDDTSGDGNLVQPLI